MLVSSTSPIPQNSQMPLPVSVQMENQRQLDRIEWAALEARLNFSCGAVPKNLVNTQVIGQAQQAAALYDQIQAGVNVTSTAVPTGGSAPTVVPLNKVGRWGTPSSFTNKSTGLNTGEYSSSQWGGDSRKYTKEDLACICPTGAMQTGPQGFTGDWLKWALVIGAAALILGRR
jgi:hypothetical protein